MTLLLTFRRPVVQNTAEGFASWSLSFNKLLPKAKYIKRPFTGPDIFSSSWGSTEPSLGRRRSVNTGDAETTVTLRHRRRHIGSGRKMCGAPTVMVRQTPAMFVVLLLIYINKYQNKYIDINIHIYVTLSIIDNFDGLCIITIFQRHGDFLVL